MEREKERDCKLALHCLHCHQATPIFPHAHIWLARLPATVCSPCPPSSYRLFPSLSPRSVSLQAARQWMSPVRHKLLNSTASLSLALSSSLALSVLPHLRSRQSLEHRHSDGATEDWQRKEERAPHWHQRSSESIYNNSITSVICTTVQSKAEATDSSQLELLLQLMLSRLIGAWKRSCNSACSCHLLGFESQFPCVKQMHWLCPNTR